jgi:hypothetical protein
MGDNHLPDGFVRFKVGGADAVTRDEFADVIRGVLGESTLYEYGARHPVGRRFSGRGVAYAVPLPSGDGVVIRHSRHGGALADVRRDLFFPPTRAPRELRVSERLRLARIPTPPVLAYAIYRAGPLFRRADVITREISDAFDLSVALMSHEQTLRGDALAAAAILVRALSAVGARHPDLNAKNVLLEAGPGGALVAYVLDVDQIEFLDNRGLALERNVARLLRSARKWRTKFGALVTENELTNLAAACRANAI